MTSIAVTILIAILNVALGYAIADHMGYGPSAARGESSEPEVLPPAPPEVPAAPPPQGNGEDMLREMIGSPGAAAGK